MVTTYNMKKILGLLLLFTLLLGIGIVGAGYFPFHHSSFTRTAQRIVQAKTGLDSCSVGTVSIALFHQITITDLYAVKKIGDGRQIVFSVPKLKIRYRFLYLLARWKQSYVITKNIFKPFRSKFEWDNRPEMILRNVYNLVDEIDTVLVSGVRSIMVDDFSVHRSDSGNTVFRVIDLSGTLSTRLDSVSDIAIRGNAKDVLIDNLALGQPVFQFRIIGPHCTIKKMEGTLYEGKVKVEANLDLKNNRINDGKIEFQEINCAKWYATQHDTVGTLTGLADITLRIEKSGTVFSQLKGEGEVKASNITADDLAFITKIALLTDLAKINHLSFKEIKGDFIIRDERIWSDNCKGEGEPLSVAVAGWIRPQDRSFNVNTKGTFEAYYKDSIPALLWDSLLPEDDDRRSFVCTISGTTASPSVIVDKQIARRAVSNVFKSIGDELKSMFGKKRKKMATEE